MRVTVSPLAERDLESIGDYIDPERTIAEIARAVYDHFSVNPVG